MNVIAETIRKAENPSISQVDLPKITSFLIKVTARCNLNCDYCYVFNHADQSWKKMPSALSSENRKILATRIGEYAQKENLDQCLILFHGGEPLLVGVERLIEITQLIKKAMPSQTKVYFSLQTNGTLLNKDRLEALAQEEIGISLSLDGPKHVNDIHRLSQQGNSTFEKTLNALKLLKQYPNTFMGVIGVIDPRVPPRELLSFFSELMPPQLDFLLPDSNYVTLPPLRDKNPNIYVDWLIEAFNIWYDEYPELNLRLFDGLIGVIAGLPSQTDAFGLGDVSLLTIETDGFYHDLDVLKITEDGFSSLGLHIQDSSIQDAISSTKIQAHRKLLTLEGLSDKCKACPEVKICGGGSVPHRYNTNGFNNPTIYCREMLALISHIRRRLVETVSLSTQKKKAFPVAGFEALNVVSYERAHFGNLDLEKVTNEWRARSLEKLLKAINYVSQTNADLKDLQKKFDQLPQNVLKDLATRPSTLLWIKVLEQHQQGLKLYDIEGTTIPFTPRYLRDIYHYQFQTGLEIHVNDYWLRCPFGNSIIFEPDEIREEGIRLVKESMKIIEELDPPLKEEIVLLSRHIQLIRDPSAHPDKVVSFSDNVVPGALYVSIRKSKGYINPYDLADSIIHEHRHQKLYLLEQFVPVVASDVPLVPSPWRQELRPVSGVYHGAFVFHQLKSYWNLVYKNRTGELKVKANNNMKFSRESLIEAIKTLKTTSITPAGRKILEEFENGNIE